MGENVAFENKAFKAGQYILNKQYRIVQCVYRRPRLNLYLAQHVRSAASASQSASQSAEKQETTSQEEPLVAVRELLLEGLSSRTRGIIGDAAAHESFSTPMPGSFLLESGKQARVENDRHYLVMQLHIYAHEQPATPITLEQLLLQPEWPSWLTTRVILSWGSQLCRSVARLHRLGVLFGNLSPSSILVDKNSASSWAPIQLVSWPPAPQFWPEVAFQTNMYELYDSVFPIARPEDDDVFVAPELFQGSCDERADVYSLGAILYLLLTRYAPAAAVKRLSAMYEAVYTRPPFRYRLEPTVGLELTLPRFIRPGISPLLEQVLLRALDVKSERRYQTVFELVEALEALGQVEAQPNVLNLHKDESIRTLLRQIMRH